MNYRSESASILLVDDDQAALRSLQRSLETQLPDSTFLSCHSAQEATKIASKEKPSAAVVDLTLDSAKGPDSGLELITELLGLDPSIRIVVLTGHQTEEYGVKALQHGAASFLEKPANVSHLAALLRDGVQYSRLFREHFSTTTSDVEELAKKTGLRSLDPVMTDVLNAVSYASQTLQPVLISGETGTGKGVIASTIHRLSRERRGPFIRYQPSFATHDLIASELFGHKKGSFTGAVDDRMGLIEEANQGTLFIDEVDELPKDTQVSLLNVLQEKTFRRIGENRDRRSDFRLLVATNQPLESLVEKEMLRADFYHRVAHFQINLPPLRERTADIPDLAQTYINDIASKEALGVRGITAEALALLSSYRWPGNIRELLAVVEGGAYRAHFESRALVRPEDLTIPNTTPSPTSNARTFRERVQEFESKLIKEALHRHNNNQTKAAESLGLDRSSFRRILQRNN